MKNQATTLKRSTKALYLAAGDQHTPLAARILIALLVAYALSPIDLIPDFIPVIGLLDDLIILPLGVALVIRMIPDQVWQQCLQQADQPLMMKSAFSPIITVSIILLWLWLLLLCTDFISQWLHLL
ncbi:DUF1232 domain-containing protein [Mariprofundus erugo]|uniref:DUF1232 domain-containing protein n=1 Tax=Mariprofundus erugo TaxID=2528639 RepID=A0A5R9GZQ1_9PROT|nr:DUF1232 domain-containing protein [Mariprofundus erugo]TLS75280.1 DUF1232 domain-containing protein [Mariprofundus erugo]